MAGGIATQPVRPVTESTGWHHYVPLSDTRPEWEATEDGVEDQTTENRSMVRKHKVAFNRARGEALSRDASRDLILEAAEQWKTI